MRDFTSDLRELSGRLVEARKYLRIDSLTERLVEVEKEVSRPDLWDDQD
jgi:hypothetical protein